MEEKSIISNNLNMSLSDWKLKQNMFQNQRNHRQLENRLLILDIQKKKKIKEIEKKLDQHKRLIEVKIDKFKFHKQMEKSQSNFLNEEGSNSKAFRQMRMTRLQNIRSKTNDLYEQKARLFRQIKEQKCKNEDFIKKISNQELQAKTEKRNKVRLIEIESKENITQFWNTKIQSYQEQKKKMLAKKLEEHENNIAKLMRLENSELQLLDQIKKTEEMEFELSKMMEEEKGIDGQALSQIYSIKID